MAAAGGMRMFGLALRVVLLLGAIGDAATVAPGQASRGRLEEVQEGSRSLPGNHGFGGLLFLSPDGAAMRSGSPSSLPDGKRRRLRTRQAESTRKPGFSREGLSMSSEVRHYDISFEPHFDTLTFSGRAVLDLDVRNDTAVFPLNSVGLNITSASALLFAIKDDGPFRFYQANWTQVSPDVVEFTFPTLEGKTLPAGIPARLDISYVGSLRADTQGFYASRYTLPDGTVGIQAITQFESADAHAAFPCVDEPDIKSSFTVTLIAEKGLTTLSNMNVDYEDDVVSKVTNTTKKAVRFNTSPLMSTYLVSFAVGNFSYVESKPGDFHVPVRVYVPPSQDVETARYSLEVAIKGLKFYEQFTRFLFSMPKMDLVAVTEFGPGAMENWGMSTFRAALLSFDPRTGAVKGPANNIVILHELAHQWFGDVVTMQTWEQIWLNEGFATFMTWLAISKINPEWLPWEEFQATDLQDALQVDSIRLTHRVEIRLDDPSVDYFDDLSYHKGAAVLRMMLEYVGEKSLADGLSLYLNYNAYNNVVTDDLWRYIGQAAGRDVAAVMRPWTRELGYPVLTVMEDGDTIQLQQHRFLLTGDTKAEEDTTLWPIFVRLRTKNGLDTSKVMTTRNATLTIAKDQADFLLLNADYTGFLRVNYSPERLKKLATQAQEGKLTISERIGLVADASALSTSGQQNTTALLDLLSALRSDTSYHVHLAMAGAFESLTYAFRGSPGVAAAISRLQASVSAPAAKRLGWTFSGDDSQLQQRFKALAFREAGLGGDEAVVKAAKEMFGKVTRGEEGVDPNLRSAVLVIGVAAGGTEEYDAALKYYQSTPRVEDKRAAVAALGSAALPSLIARSVSLLLSNEVRTTDKRYLVDGLTNSGKPQLDAVLELLEKSWADLAARYGSAGLGTWVRTAVGRVAGREQLGRAAAFFGAAERRGVVGSLAETLEFARARVQWGERDGAAVKAWFGLG